MEPLRAPRRDGETRTEGRERGRRRDGDPVTGRALDRQTDNLTVGTAGEYIVCADLLLEGYSAFRADQAAPYDVAVDVGSRLIRVQVKSTRAPRNYPQQRQQHICGYAWNTRSGKGARRALKTEAVDVIALVALDVRKVAYVPCHLARQTMQIHVTGHKTSGVRSFESSTFAIALALLKR
jgi:hypothetical protein